jgi:tripartite-type tricarboxylate transporter receptor subunit TctC
MKKILLVILIAATANLSVAKEKIVVLNPQGPSHSGTPQLIAVIETANRQQNKYQFVMEFKPGAFESIALRELETDPGFRISTMTNAAIEGIDRGFINESKLVPVFGQGDSCWAVIGVTKNNQGLESLKSLKELVVGGPAIGGATHLAALEIGRRYNLPVRYVVYKSNYDAFINMVADSSITFIFERVKNYEAFKDKNPNMHILAMSCPTRHPKQPSVKTLREYGIDTPYIWQQIVASTSMPPDRLQEIRNILATATKTVGLEKIQELSDQTPPMFLGITSEEFYNQSLTKLKTYRKKFKQEIEDAR